MLYPGEYSRDGTTNLALARFSGELTTWPGDGVTACRWMSPSCWFCSQVCRQSDGSSRNWHPARLPPMIKNHRGIRENGDCTVVVAVAVFLDYRTINPLIRGCRFFPSQRRVRGCSPISVPLVQSGLIAVSSTVKHPQGRPNSDPSRKDERQKTALNQGKIGGERPGGRTPHQRIKSPKKGSYLGRSAIVHTAYAVRLVRVGAASANPISGPPVRFCSPRPLLTWALPSGAHAAPHEYGVGMPFPSAAARDQRREASGQHAGIRGPPSQ